MYIFRMYVNDLEEYECQNGMDNSSIPLDIGHFYLCFLTQSDLTNLFISQSTPHRIYILS